MGARRTAAMIERGIRARHDRAIERRELGTTIRELREPCGPRFTAKKEDPETRRMIEAALAKRKEKEQ